MAIYGQRNMCDKYGGSGVSLISNNNSSLSEEVAKEYLFNHFIERAIIEDCVAVILPPHSTYSFFSEIIFSCNYVIVKIQ